MQKETKLIFITSVGTILEWAEYTFFGYLALTLSSIFFPESTDNIALIKTFCLFAVGFFMRPLGAIIFGHIGDKFNRRAALIGSIVLMGAATFCIGLIPGYYQIGIKAPLMLLILRALQGIAVSGEYNGAAIFLIEQSNNKKPCLAGSWICAAAALGMALGGFAAFIATLPSMPIWAWRVPFLLGGLSCFIGMGLRFFIPKDFVVKPLSKEENTSLPLIQIIKYQKSFLYISSIAAFIGIFVYICNVYLVAFLVREAQLAKHIATFIAMSGQLLIAILIPIFGVLADNSNPHKMFRLSLILTTFLAPFIFWLALSGNYYLIALGIIIYVLLNASLSAPLMYLLQIKFPAHLRYTGISLAWSLAVAIFSGTAPVIATILNAQYNLTLGPSLYVSLAAIVTLICTKNYKHKKELKLQELTAKN